jgi:hypothetical protein
VHIINASKGATVTTNFIESGPWRIDEAQFEFIMLKQQYEGK